MTGSFLIAGIACIAAAIVGGGLEAFGIRVPIVNSVNHHRLPAGKDAREIPALLRSLRAARQIRKRRCGGG